MEIAEDEYNKLVQTYSEWKRSGYAEPGCACPNYVPSRVWENELTIFSLLIQLKFKL